MRDLRIGRRDFEPAVLDITESVEIRTDYGRAVKAMDGLTALQREAVSLAYFSGFTISEMATTLGVNTSTIKTRIRDGLARLREELQSPQALIV